MVPLAAFYSVVTAAVALSNRPWHVAVFCLFCCCCFSRPLILSCRLSRVGSLFVKILPSFQLQSFEKSSLLYIYKLLW